MRAACKGSDILGKDCCFIIKIDRVNFYKKTNALWLATKSNREGNYLIIKYVIPDAEKYFKEILEKGYIDLTDYEIERMLTKEEVLNNIAGD